MITVRIFKTINFEIIYLAHKILLVLTFSLDECYLAWVKAPPILLYGRA